jgi:hypothetical protein
MDLNNSVSSQSSDLFSIVHSEVSAILHAKKAMADAKKTAAMLAATNNQSQLLAEDGDEPLIELQYSQQNNITLQLQTMQTLTSVQHRQDYMSALTMPSQSQQTDIGFMHYGQSGLRQQSSPFYPTNLQFSPAPVVAPSVAAAAVTEEKAVGKKVKSALGDPSYVTNIQIRPSS